MFKDATIGLSRHAIQRFKLRIDPTATVAQIIGYVRESVPPTTVRQTMQLYGYNAEQMLKMHKVIEVRHKHITFVVAPKKGKGRGQITVVTCY